MNRQLELARDVVAGLREQRRQRRERHEARPRASRARRRSLPGVQAVLLIGLVLSVLGLATTGTTTFLVSTVVLAVLLWAIEEGGSGRGGQQQIIVTHAPHPQTVPAPYAGPIPDATPMAVESPPAPEPRFALPALASTRRPPRDARGLDYEATLGQLMSTVGSSVVVSVAPAGDRGGMATATTIAGTLEPGAVTDHDSSGRPGRGLFFGVGSGDNGFFLPALEFVGATSSADGELLIRLRSYSVSVRTERTTAMSSLTD